MHRRRTIVRRPRHARGFTLIETALATIIVGLGVVAGVQLFATCTQQNRASAEMSIASMLATNIQEATGELSFADPGSAHAVFGAEAGETLATYDDVDDFDGKTYNPPIDSLRQGIPNMSQYSQVISVWPVYPSEPSVNSNESSPDLPKSTNTGALRVRVRILYAATPNDLPAEVYRASWIRMDN